MNILHYARREVIGRPWRTLLNATSVAVGVALVIILFSVTLAYQKAVAAPFSAAGTDFALSRPSQAEGTAPAARGVMLPASNQAIEVTEINRLTGLPEVQQAVAVLQLWSFDPGQFKVIVGLAPDAPAIGPAKVQEWLKDGHFYGPGEQGVAVLESHFARFYKYKVGDQITISGKKFQVAGIYEVRQGTQLTAANIYLPLADAQSLAGVGPDTVNGVYLELRDTGLWKMTIDSIHRDFPDLAVSSVDSALAMSDSMLALLNRVALPAAALVVGICLLFVYYSLATSVWERVGEFGTMKALGWRYRDTFYALTLELFFQVAFGTMLGLALGALGTYLASAWQVNAPQVGEIPPLPGMDTAASTIHLPALFPAPLYLASFAGALIVGLLVATVVARQVAALKPAEAWRHL